ncbi:hypothetical protein B0H21DRAFT_719964 [Amylocystis lapponica]|nr:hypothetical protein B0H21DRAFT_719964 [Amylocystis lapponica]
MNDILIPYHAVHRPSKNRITSLSREMGLSRSSETFTTFTKGLRELTPKYLDTCKNFQEQGKERWLRFFHEARQKFTFVNQYDGAWPIEFYLRMHLERTKYSHGLHARKGQASPSLSRSISDRPRRHCYVGDYSKLQKNPNPLAPRRSQASAEETHHRVEQSTPRTPRGSEAATVTRATPSQSPSGTSEVEEFLRSLRPSIEGLAQGFAAAGVVDAECLFALAAMPEAERYMLLKEDMCLSSFQVRIVRVALERIRSL